MLKTIAIIAVVLIAAILGYAMTVPDNFRVQRTTSIKAPPEKIFPLIIDLHSWGSWSPWEKLDPTMKRTHSGAASGMGADRSTVQGAMTSLRFGLTSTPAGEATITATLRALAP